MNRTTTPADTIVEEITIERPAERVFEAFTDPTERVRWWGLAGRFQTTQADSDLRPGGRWSMRGTRPDGSPFTVKGVYLTVERPSLLIFTWLPSWQGEETESQVRVELKKINDVTHVRLTHSGLITETLRTSHRGWPQILRWLQAYVEAR
jgi:uncharacterized protein YndB with AHSA1/START domain